MVWNSLVHCLCVFDVRGLETVWNYIRGIIFIAVNCSNYQLAHVMQLISGCGYRIHVHVHMIVFVAILINYSWW